MTEKEKMDFLNSILDGDNQLDEKKEEEINNNSIAKNDNFLNFSVKETISENDEVKDIKSEISDFSTEQNSENFSINQDIEYNDQPVDEKSDFDFVNQLVEDDEEKYTYSAEDEEREKRKKTKKKKKKTLNTVRFIIGLVCTVVIIAIAVFGALFVIRFVKAFTGIDRNEIQIVVDIPEGSTTTDIAEILSDNGVIEDPELFILFSKFKKADASYVAGSHVVSPNMTFSNIIEKLQENPEIKRESVDITFYEGITLNKAAELLEENGVCEADRFIYIFNSSSFGYDFESQIESDVNKFYKMEGYFFPDTYSFYKDEEPEVVAKKIYKNFENRVTPDYFGRMEDLGYSLEDTIILASMVQAEANNPSDMKKIASVFINRLNNDDFPKLESDPTRKYVEDVIIPNIEVQDNEMNKLYNTYECEGLPVGAICNPGLDAINAVLYPSETDYYFFCANINTGETFFAETLKEHNENLVRAGIMSVEELGYDPDSVDNSEEDIIIDDENNEDSETESEIF